MNTSIKQKVNGVARLGQIIVFILIIACVLSILGDVLKVLIGEFWETPEYPMADFYTTGAWPTHSIESVKGALIVLEDVTSIVICLLLMRVVNGFYRCDTPFEAGVIRRMYPLAWALLGFAVIVSFANAATVFVDKSLILYKAGISFQRHGRIVDSTPFSGAVRELLVPNAWYFVSVGLLFLTRIFQHGAQLQKESDETL